MEQSTAISTSSPVRSLKLGRSLFICDWIYEKGSYTSSYKYLET